jgi:hypothetical protein
VNDNGEVIAAVCLVGAVYCTGGLHGLWLAWTQPVRMAWWAAKTAQFQAFLLECQEKGTTHRCVCGDSHCRGWRRTSSRPRSTGGASEMGALTPSDASSEGASWAA